MTIEEKVFTALTAGSPAPLRAYPDLMPQYPTYPLVTYIIVAGEDDIHLNGDAGTARRLVQVDAWARTRLGAAQTMAIAKTQMLAAEDFTVGRVDISGAPTYEPDPELYRASLEFSVHYET
jgi:hypothetical protein